MNPAREVVEGLDISFGSLPCASSSTVLLVAFMLANYEHEEEGMLEHSSKNTPS